MKTLLAFPASAIKESKKATPDVVSIKQPKMIFEFGFPSMIAYFQRSISSSSSFMSSISSRFIYFVIFSQKHDS